MQDTLESIVDWKNAQLLKMQKHANEKEKPFRPYAAKEAEDHSPYPWDGW
jgi:hypothetical protein